MMTIATNPHVDTTTSPFQEVVTEDEEVALSSLFPSPSSKAVASYRSGECNGTSTSKRAHSIGSNQTVETSDLTLPTVTSSCNLISKNDNNNDCNDNSANFYQDFFEMSSNTSSDDEFRFIIEDSGAPPLIETEELMIGVDNDDEYENDNNHCDAATEISQPPVRLDEQVAVTAFMTSIPPSNGNRSSIVKPYDFDVKLIKNSGWKNLPKLDCVSIGLENKKMNILRKEQTETAALIRQKALSASKPTVVSPASSTESSTTTKKKKKKTRSPTVVTFGFIALRNYDQTIGDNPSVSYGTPIQLDWNYEELGVLINVDDYELGRSTRRSAHQMMLNYYQRRNILQYWYGHLEKELDSAEKNANSLKLQRSITRMFLPYAFVEDAATSVVRKAKRRFNPLSSSTVAPTSTPIPSVNSSVSSATTGSRKHSIGLTKSSSESAISCQSNTDIRTSFIAGDSKDGTTSSLNNSESHHILSQQQPKLVVGALVQKNDDSESQLIEC